MRLTLRILVCCGLLASLFAGRADAQYRKYPVAQPVTGEAYHLELSGDLWGPAPTLVFASAGGSALTGLLGTNIDAVNDLGFSKTTFKELRVVLRPAKKHKFRFDYIPIAYAGDTKLNRDITFNGILYKANLPVQSSLDWKAYHFGYEYDFLYRERWYLGLVLQAKYTSVDVKLDSPVDHEFASVAAPIPAIGGILRVYPLPFLSFTGEVTGFKLPASVDKQNRYDGKYMDVNIYGTLNITNNFGVQGGYRSIDVMYRVKEDTGNFTLGGMYFGGVARF